MTVGPTALAAPPAGAPVNHTERFPMNEVLW